MEKSRHPNRRYYTDTHVAYRYIVSNKTLEGSFTKDGDHSSVFKSGARAKVCYNPSKPEESEVFTLDHQCGQ